MNSRPPVVYLDAQDFSRFGRVVEGIDRSDAARIFEQLLAHAERGSVSFAYSMSTLSELLQFHPDYEQTSLAKARAVELLCRGNAMANIARLVAYEVASFALEKGLIATLADWSAQSTNDYWFPNLGNIFLDFRKKFEESRQDSLQQFAGLNR